MHTRRSIIPAVLAAAFLSLFAAAPLAAQQWVDDLLLVASYEDYAKDKWYVNWCFIDENDYIQSTIPSLTKALDFPVPQEQRTHPAGCCWFDDAFYSAWSSVWYKSEKDSDGVKFKRYTFAKWQDKEWQYLGEFRHKFKEEYSGLYFIPCDNGRFIAVSENEDLMGPDNQEPSPFAKMVLRPSKKEVVLDSSIYHGIDELKYQMKDPRVFKLAGKAGCVVTGKYATIINEITGLYWCFSLEKASLVKAGSIFKGIDPEEMLKTIQRGGFTTAVLDFRPEKNGTVLVSALEEAALKGGIADKWDDLKEKYDKPLPKNLSKEEREKLDKEREKAFIEDQKKIAQSSPYIVWYRIHPENGRVEKLGVPPIGGAHERASWWKKLWLGMEFYKADQWRPLPDGSVRMGPWEPKPKAAKETAQTGKK